MHTKIAYTAATLLGAMSISLIFSSMSNCQETQSNHWPRFRGPNGTGFVADAKPPTKWTETDYAWKIKLAGSGSSSPVVWGSKVFINSCDPKTAEFTVQCLDLKTGAEFWKKSYPSKAYRQHLRNSYASSTPAVDKDFVYVSFANPDETKLIALDHSGQQIWQRDFGRWVAAHGFSMSPIVYEDKVIFVNSQQAQRVRNGEPGYSRVIAVDRKTGKDQWTTRLTATRACYALPCVLSVQGKKDQLIGCNTGDGFYSLNPDDGSFNWKQDAFPLRTVASTLLADGLLIGSCGSGGGGNQLVAVKPNDDGAKKVYNVMRNANYVPTPVAVGDLLFTFADNGIVCCLDLQTGKQHWRERVSAGFSGSPVANKTHVYCIDEKGVVVVIQANKQFKLVARNPLAESSRATPAIVGNQLLLRTDNHLICVGK
jgi:outer membrane protein assembly factor BamB